MASNTLEEINNELGDLIQQQRKKLIVDVDEHTFRHRLLPLAAARYSNVDKEIDLTHWQAITGRSPTHGVRVIRDGIPLFTTPPLILSPEMSFQGKDLNTAIREAEKRERAGFPKGELMDKDVLQPHLQVKGLASSLTTWVLILRFYGIHLQVVDENGVVVNQPTPVPALPDETKPTDKAELYEEEDDGEVL